MLRPTFVESEDHITYRNKDGIIVPSVTTLIKLINKESLLYWSNNLGFKHKSVKKELEISAYIGSTIHDMVEKYTTTGIYSLEDINRTGPAEKLLIKNGFLSFLKFFTKEKENFDIIWTEHPLSGKRFGGTLDLYTKYNEKLTLADYKTSKEFYPTMVLQLAGYDILMRELHNIKVEQYMVLLINKYTGDKAKVKIIDNKDEMKFYRKCFKELVLFYYSWITIEQQYWK